MASGLIDTYADEEIQLLRNEREALRDEIADLRAQLDFEERLRDEVATLSARNRTLSRRWYDALHGNVYKAIEARRATGACKSEVEELNHIAWDWLRLTEHNDRVCRAAARVNHAGLHYLAVEADWVDILERYGHQEAAEFVEQLAHARDQHEVTRIVEEWENQDSLGGN